MSRVDDVLSIARLHKSQAEADVLRDMYFTENPSVIVEFCDAVIDLLEKQPRWIPVTDRLPQDNKDVLVYINVTYRDLAYAYCDMAYCDEGVWYDEEHNHLKNITHWMEKPEPPKEDEA